MAFLGTGHAKLLLFGEHAAVQGFPALGVTLPWHTAVSITPTGDRMWHLDQVRRGYRDIVLKLLQRAADVAGRPSGVEGMVTIESNVPKESGFGSSAALCVAAVSALLSHIQQPEALWEAAHEVEKIFHGTPSGIDTGLASASGICSFQSHQTGLPTRKTLVSPPLYLIVGAVKRVGSAKAIILDLGRRFREGDSEAVGSLTELGRLAEAAITLIGEGKSPSSLLPELGSYAASAQQSLAALGLSTPDLERILERGMNIGALGGKLSGAGGGGAFFLLAESGEESERIAEDLSAFCSENGIETVSSPAALTL